MTKAKKTKRPSSDRRVTIDYKGRPSRERRPPPIGTCRHALFHALKEAGKKGAPFDALNKAAGFADEKSTRQALRLLSVRDGYAVRGDRSRVTLG